ncbi:MAG TPA: enoyl-CoA hydratase-related protein [Chloroflexota bacterium]|jgi:2-(1,2-epoxy-1,2-dihydrophenyl)acetyl-CoA isomerase|nr:enoyl-CoA hydratase-related protein [Chloroflexota bacterium]
MAEPLLIDTHEGVQTLTLNQPARMNALSQPMLQSLNDALRAAERDEATRAMVLTGAPPAFSSGADITEFTFEPTIDLGELLERQVNPVVTRLRSIEKPVLAAVNGVAAGAGMSLALACDIRFAGESVRFVLAFVRIGLVPDGGCLYFLPRLIGPAKALELAWTGDPVSAQAAYELGMVNRVVPDDQVLPQTQELAARLARGPARTLALIKRAVKQAHELPFERVLDLEVSYQKLAGRHRDFAEGVAAFREKRPARFGMSS